MKKTKTPKAKYISEYKEKINYSVKTIEELAMFVEHQDVTIIKLNGNYYRIELLNHP